MKRDEAEDIVWDLIDAVRNTEYARIKEYRKQFDALTEQKERVIQLLMQNTEGQDGTASVSYENPGVVSNSSE